MVTFLLVVSGLIILPAIVFSIAFNERRQLILRELGMNFGTAIGVYLVSWIVMIQVSGFRGHTNAFLAWALVCSVVGLLMFNLIRRVMKKQNGDSTKQ